MSGVSIKYNPFAGFNYWIPVVYPGSEDVFAADFFERKLINDLFPVFGQPITPMLTDSFFNLFDSIFINFFRFRQPFFSLDEKKTFGFNFSNSLFNLILFMSTKSDLLKT